MWLPLLASVCAGDVPCTGSLHASGIQGWEDVDVSMGGDASTGDDAGSDTTLQDGAVEVLLPATWML